MRLIKFEKDPKHAVYAYTTLTDKQIEDWYSLGRKFREFHLSIWDHGGEDYEVFAEQILEGKLTEVVGKDQVAEKDWNVLPYATDEMRDNPEIYVQEWLGGRSSSEKVGHSA